MVEKVYVFWEGNCVYETYAPGVHLRHLREASLEHQDVGLDSTVLASPHQAHRPLG